MYYFYLLILHVYLLIKILAANEHKASADVIASTNKSAASFQSIVFRFCLCLLDSSMFVHL